MLYLFFFAFFLSSNIQAQHPFAWQFTEVEGLPSIEVYDLYQDSKAYIWIATSKGLCRYNGLTFQYYTNALEKGKAVTSIQEDSLGRIWVQNFKGQLFYVEHDSLHHFPPTEEINLLDINRFLIDYKNDIWIVTRASSTLWCYRSKEKKWKKWLVDIHCVSQQHRHIHDLTLTGTDELLLLSNCGLHQLKNNNVHFLSDTNLAFNQLNHIINGHFLRVDSSIFIPQSFREQYHISQLHNNQAHPTSDIYNKDYFLGKQAHATRYLSDGTVWQLSLDAGAAIIMNSKKQSNVDTNLFLFPDLGISDIIIDHEGNYWVSTLKKGIYCIPKIAIQYYTPSNSIFKQETFGILGKSITQELLISTDNGKILSFNPPKNEISHYYKTLPVPSQYITSYGDEIIAGGLGYTYGYHYKDSLHHKHCPQNPLTRKNAAIYKDSLIVLSGGSTGWGILGYQTTIGTSPIPKEIFPSIQKENVKFEYKNFTIHSLGLLSQRCNWVLTDNNNNRIFVAYIDTLMCYPERAHHFPILNEKKQIIQATQLTWDRKGILWASTNNAGIYGINSKLEIAYHITTSDGLLSNDITKIEPDKDSLWILTKNGIQFCYPHTKKFRTYTIQDGLPTHEIKDITVLNNKVWLSTTKGLVSFDKNMASTNQVAPIIRLKGFSINEKDTLLKSSYHLLYNQNTIAIHFEGVAFRSRGKFQYKYRMIGLDSIWRTQPSSIDVVRFFQLSANDYTFEIKAINEDGIESQEIATLKFTISPPYWKTWWFYSLILLLTLLIISTIVWNQLQQQRLKIRVNSLHLQALQSQMNPHFIFNVLTAVQNLWLQKKYEPAMSLQSSFAKLLRKIFQYSSEKAISIEQIEDFLMNYLELEQIRFENKVEIDFQINDELLDDDYFIPPLLIQPIIENSFKHGLFHKEKDRKLIIKLQKEQAYLYCMVEDNGVGRKPKPNNYPARTSGLSTTKERLNILQESVFKTSHPFNNFKITDLKSEDNTAIGTRVEMWIPFIKV